MAELAHAQPFSVTKQGCQAGLPWTGCLVANAVQPACKPAARLQDVTLHRNALHRYAFHTHLLGTSHSQDPTSLLTGQACSQQPNRNVTLSNIRQTVFRWFEGGWKKDFAARQPGMAVRLRLLTADQVPTSVRAAASAET